MVPAKNKRSERRFPYVGPIRISWEDQGSPCFGIAKFVDMSASGVCIESLQSVRAGSRIFLGAEKVKLTGSAVVKHVARRGGKYRLGIQLTQAALTKFVAALEDQPEPTTNPDSIS